MRRLLILTALLLTLGGCFTVPSLNGQDGTKGIADTKPGTALADHDGSTTDVGVAATEGQADALSEVQTMIVIAAREVLDTQSTIVGDTTFSYDCSGTILTVYAHAGIHLVDLFPRYTGNGVARIHGIATDYDVLHSRDLPETGDVIFWDNTYDRNEDGNWNDPLTHAGLVISVEADGTVEYLHHNYRRGIVTATMNLLEPETYQDDSGKMLNAPMRMASQRASNPDLWLSSHLFREFASLHEVRIETASATDPIAVAALQ